MAHFPPEGIIRKQLLSMVERQEPTLGLDTLAGHLGLQSSATLFNGLNTVKPQVRWRNQEMLDSGIDLVVAFPDGRGTADMLRRVQLAGVPADLAGMV